MPSLSTRVDLDKKLILLSIMAQFIGPLPVTISTLFFVEMAYPIDNITGAVSPPYYVNPTLQFYVSIFTTLLYFSNSLLMLILYSLIVRTIRQHINQVIVFGQETELANTDKKLVFFGLSLFVMNLVQNIFFFSFAFVSPEKDMASFLVVAIIFMIISDLLAYCNPWFMLFFSKSVRKHFWDFITCKPTQT